MPPLSTNEVDPLARSLIEQWITSMKPLSP
jgi:hypothetical protein